MSNRFKYTDDQRVIFSHYLDVSDPENVTTLVPEPGQVYDIKQADSPRIIQPDGQFTDQELAMPPSGAFTATSDPTWFEAKKAAEEAAAKAEQSAKTAEAKKAAEPKKKESGTDA